MPSVPNPPTAKNLHDIPREGFPADKVIDAFRIKIEDFTPWSMNSWFSEPKYKPAGPNKTALDFDYRWNDRFVSGTAIRITLLIDPDIQDYARFIPEDPTRDPVNLALTASDEQARDALCDLNWVSPFEINFLLKYVDGAPRIDFNVGVLFRNGRGEQTIPVIYDPTVPNDGS